MKHATGNIINDRAWGGSETIPGMELRRWTGYVDVLEGRSGWYAISLPNTGRSDDILEPDRVMVLPYDYNVTHFGIVAEGFKARSGTLQFSLRNPGFLINEEALNWNDALPGTQRNTVGPALLVVPGPYLSHQAWVNVPAGFVGSGRLTVSIGAVRKAEVFDFFVPGVRAIGPAIWGQRRDGSIGIIPGSEGWGDEGIRPGGRDFPDVADPAFSITPGFITLIPGETVTLTASEAASWTVSGGGVLSSTTGGTVTYTAPMTAASVTISAISTVTPTNSAQASIVVSLPANPATAIAITPNVVALLQGETQTFTATVQGDPSNGVTWSAPGLQIVSQSGSTITVRPTTSGTFTLSATSTLNPAIQGSATITSANVTNVIIDTLPTTAIGSVNLSGYSVGSNLPTADVTWEVIAPAGVTISQTSGTTGTLGAIPGLTTPTLVSFRARSVADPTKTATSSITIIPPVVVTAVSLTSNDYSLNPSQSATLTATVATSGALDTAGVNYTISGPGTLSGSGLTRTVVATGVGTITATATSIADPTKSSTVTIGVGVANEVTSVDLTGTSTIVGPLGIVNLTATVNGTGSYSGAVSYTVLSGPGALMAGALNGINTPATLTMGATPTSGTTIIEARSVADPTKFKTFTVTLAPNASVTTIVVSPSVASIAPGQSFTATATVSGAGVVPQAVTWTVTGPATFTGTGNAINVTATGPGTIVMTATSVANPGVTGQASIVSAVVPTVLTVTAFRVGGSTAPVTGGASASVDAAVTGTGLFNSAVTWSILTGPGSIAPGSGNLATYTAPGNATNGQQVILRAIAQGDSTKFADLTLNLSSANVISSVVVVATPTTTMIGSSVNLNATVFGSGVFSQNVLWSIDSGSASLIPGAASAPNAVLVGSVVGTVIVRATSVDDPTKSGTVSIGVGVIPSVSSVVLDKTLLTLIVGDTATVDATVLGAGGFDGGVTWAPDILTNPLFGSDVSASVVGNRLTLVGVNGDVVETAGGQPASIVYWTATSIADTTRKATVAIRTKALVTGLQVTSNRVQVDAFGKPGVVGSPNFQQAKLTAIYLGAGRLTPPSFTGPGGITWTVTSGPGLLENNELGVGFVSGTSAKMLTALDPSGVINVTASQANMNVSGAISISNISAPLDPAAVAYIGNYPYSQDEKLWLSNEINSLKISGVWSKLISLCIPGFAKNLIHGHTSIVNTSEPKNTPVALSGVLQTHTPFGHEHASGLGIRPIGGTPTGFTKLPWTEAHLNAIPNLSFGVGSSTSSAPPFTQNSGMDLGLWIVGTGIGQPSRAFELSSWIHIAGVATNGEGVAGRIGSVTANEAYATHNGTLTFDSRGYTAASRTADVRKFYRNGLVSAPISIPYIPGTSNTQLYLGARNQPYNSLGNPTTTPNAAEFISHRSYCMYFLGSNLTDPDHVAMNNFTFNLLSRLGI